MALGTSELLDAFAALEQVPWTEQADFKEALAATLAKSPEDRRIFELVFERFFFRAAEAEAARQQIGESAASSGDVEVDLDALRQQIAAALREGSDAALRDLARLAIAAFGRGEGSGVLGVDVQRIRRALGLRTEPQPDLPAGRPAPRRRPPRAAAALRAAPAPRARARDDRAHREPAAEAPADRARPRAADRPDPGPGGRAPGRRPAQAPAGHPGPRAQGPQAPRPRRRPAHDAGLAADRRRPDRAASTARGARGGPRSSCCATSRPA